jgi:serine/threonine-protein kinase
MCRYQNKKGVDPYYKDCKKNTVHNLLENISRTRINEGVLYHGDFRGILNYGEAIEVSKPPKGLYIHDCGTDSELATNCDVVLYILSTNPWHKRELPSWVRSQSVYLISNFSSKLKAMIIAKEIKKQIYMYPTVINSRDLTKEEERIFSKILRLEKCY